jgi:hypothetical protein
MANEVLNQVAVAEQRRRPSCRVRAIGWGPWEAGMVTASHAAHFRSLGVPLMPLDEGARAFAAELGTAGDAVQVLLAAGNGRDNLGTGPAGLAVEATVDARTHGFLADHAPAGVPVLPLAMAVEWFASAGRSRFPGRPTSLADLRVLSRVELADLATPHRFTVSGTGAGDDPDGLGLRLTSSTGVAHYRARLVAPDASPGRWTSPEAMDLILTGDSVYESPALFHGPDFQVLRRVEGLSRHGAQARVVGVRAMGWPDRPWWTDPAAIDGALQAAVLWARHATGDATLPMGIDTLHVHRAGPAAGTLRCVVRAASTAADQARCDIALLDEDGEVRAELLGVSLIRRPDLAPVPATGGAARAAA